MKSARRMYLHLYYLAEQALERERALNKLLHKLQIELESGKRNPDHEKLYAAYFEVIHTPVGGIRVAAKETAIADTKKNHGCFTLLSNDIKNSIEALEIYRNKDLVEKTFGNLKERLNLRRLAVSSEQSLDGKLFVEFLALIVLSYIKKKMQSTGLFKNTMMQELPDELDIIEGFEQPGHQSYVGEMTNRQLDLYEKLGVEPPSSLQ